MHVKYNEVQCLDLISAINIVYKVITMNGTLESIMRMYPMTNTTKN